MSSLAGGGDRFPKHNYGWSSSWRARKESERQMEKSTNESERSLGGKEQEMSAGPWDKAAVRYLAND